MSPRSNFRRRRRECDGGEGKEIFFYITGSTGMEFQVLGAHL